MSSNNLILVCGSWLQILKTVIIARNAELSKTAILASNFSFPAGKHWFLERLTPPQKFQVIFQAKYLPTTTPDTQNWWPHSSQRQEAVDRMGSCSGCVGKAFRCTSAGHDISEQNYGKLFRFHGVEDTRKVSERCGKLLQLE